MKTLKGHVILTGRKRPCALIASRVFHADTKARVDWAAGGKAVGRDGPDRVIDEVRPVNEHLVAVSWSRATT